jgi:hypothetical protein
MPSSWSFGRDRRATARTALAFTRKANLLSSLVSGRLSGHTKDHELEQLLPWNWKAERIVDAAKA